jgi:dTMP kinase
MRGKFITFEGCEGAGKSRQVKMLEQYLIENKIDYYITREPGGTAISEQIRKVILDANNSEMTDECEVLLYAASRIQLIKQELLPRLEKGQLVICDRYVDSSLAYQGFARGLGYDFVAGINEYALKTLSPDCTIFLNLPPIEAFKRKGGADKADRLEQSGLAFHEKVYGGYLELAKIHADRFCVIDPRGEREETHAKIVQALKNKGIL